MPKYHWLPFFEERISGSRWPAAFLVEGEAAINVASTIVPPRSNAPRASRYSATASNTVFVSSVRFEQMPEIQDRRLIRDRIASQFQIAERVQFTHQPLIKRRRRFPMSAGFAAREARRRTHRAPKLSKSRRSGSGPIRPRERRAPTGQQ